MGVTVPRKPALCEGTCESACSHCDTEGSILVGSTSRRRARSACDARHVLHIICDPGATGAPAHYSLVPCSVMIIMMGPCMCYSPYSHSRVIQASPFCHAGFAVEVHSAVKVITCNLCSAGGLQGARPDDHSPPAEAAGALPWQQHALRACMQQRLRRGGQETGARAGRSPVRGPAAGQVGATSPLNDWPACAPARPATAHLCSAACGRLRLLLGCHKAAALPQRLAEGSLCCLCWEAKDHVGAAAWLSLG